MDHQKGLGLLYAIIQEMKRLLGTPVIMLTKEDFGRYVIEALMDLREEMISSSNNISRLSEFVYRFHRQWLHAIAAVEIFKRRLLDTPREYVQNAIDYTINSSDDLWKIVSKYINNALDEKQKNGQEVKILNDDLKIIQEMHQNHYSALLDKEIEIFGIVDTSDYLEKVHDEIEELFNWIDDLYDNLAVQFSKAVVDNFIELAKDLTKILQQMIDKVCASDDPEAQFIARDLSQKKNKCLSVPVNSIDDMEIKKTIDDIENIEIRIKKFKDDKSCAAIALKHKAIYLQEKLRRVENLKKSLQALKTKNREKQAQINKVHIFDHLLPAEDRKNLINELLFAWSQVINDKAQNKSIISILSVTDIEKIAGHNDAISLDLHSKTLFKCAHERKSRGNLPPNDDIEFFHDDYGRFYYNTQGQKIYKAHDEASEYFLDITGLLLKYKEVRNNKDYYFDHLGRYYVDDGGNKIYTDDDINLYEYDGLGHLVKIRDGEAYPYECKERQILQLEENKYLALVVGVALKKCIAEVIIKKPEDPVMYLASRLENYHFNALEQRRRDYEKTVLAAERLRCQQEELLVSTPQSTSFAMSVADEHDDNFVAYETPALPAL